MLILDISLLHSLIDIYYEHHVHMICKYEALVQNLKTNLDIDFSDRNSPDVSKNMHTAGHQ